MVQLGAAHLGVFPEATIDSVLGHFNSIGIAMVYRLLLGLPRSRESNKGRVRGLYYYSLSVGNLRILADAEHRLQAIYFRRSKHLRRSDLHGLSKSIYLVDGGRNSWR
jgi:hypothetical protein